MASASKATDYLNAINWKSLVEWMTAEVILNRPPDPVQFCRDILGERLSERGVTLFNPEKTSDWLRNCYTEATALVDENGIVQNKIKTHSHKSLPEQLDELKRKMAAMEEIVEACKRMSSLDYLEASSNVISESSRILKCDAVNIYTTDTETHEIVGNLHEVQHSFRFPLTEGISGIVSTTGEILNIVDATQDPRFINGDRDKKKNYRTSSVLCVPLISTSTNQIIGAIEAVNKLEGVFNHEDVEAAKIIGCIAGNTLKNAIHFKEMEGYRLKTRGMLDLLRTLHADMYTPTVMSTLAHQANRIIDADRCTLYLYDYVHKSLFQMQGAVSIAVPLDQGFAGHVISTGQTKVVVDAYTDELFNPATDKKSGYRTKSMLCIPLSSLMGIQTQIVGVLQFTNKISAEVSSDASSFSLRFTEEDIYLANAFAALVGPIVNGCSVYQQLIKKAQRAKMGGSSFRGAAAIADQDGPDNNDDGDDED